MVKDCEDNIKFIKSKLSNSIDDANKVFYVKRKKIAIIYVKSLTSPKLISDIIIKPLLNLSKLETKKMTCDNIAQQLILTADCSVLPNSKNANSEILSSILQGKAIIFVNNEKSAIIVDVEQLVSRQPAEPPTSAVIYGPREGFTENAKQNLSMLRKRLPTENLVVKDYKVGNYTKTKVFVTYLKGVASQRVVKEICKRIESIDIDGIIDSHYILAFLQKNDNNFFKQAGVAEKPDIVSAKMLEGRVAIIVDNSPIVLTLPFLIFEDLQNSNDYYSNPIYVSLVRIIRILAIIVACIVPGVYLALRLYHYKVLPLRFLITIANSTEGLPFTPFIELLFILILFQILYEVSLRLPRYLGLATSIVGALILGDTGVNAGLISPPGVIIIAMSIISIYAVPDQASQLNVLRLIFLILGGTVGILGVVGFMIYLINENAVNEKYGVPYLAPYAPRIKNDLKDGIFMKSITSMKTRPKSLSNKNLLKIKDSEKKSSLSNKKNE